MTIYGIVVERRVRVATGFAIEADSLEAARAEALRLAEDTLPGTGTGKEGLAVVSTAVYATADEAAAWAARWDVPPAGGQAIDVEAISPIADTVDEDDRAPA